MIREEICTYEVCKLAKEKGFPLKEIESWHYEFDGRPTKEIVDNRQYPIIPQSLLQRWLREERGIDIVVMPIRPKGYSFFICGHIPEDDGACMDREYSLTYELALEDALKYALENLV